MAATNLENTVHRVKKKNYKWFIGVDVSKNELDFAVLRNGELLQHVEIPNKKNEIRAFCQLLKKNIEGFRMANTLLCMEETGLYSVAVAKVLYGLKANFVVENALRIKRSSGIIRGKTDREDAIMIATYASKHYQELKLWRPKRGVLEELKYLMTLRNRLLATGIALSNPMKEQDVYVAPGVLRTLKGLCHQTMDALEADKAEVESAINRLVAGDARIKRLFEVVTSVGNIGRITAIYIILSTNEFLDISCPKKFACYCGVAPFKRESGTMRKRPRVSRVGNRNMKALLHMCAMGAVLRNPELRRFFERKTKVDGKPKMAVINAVRYKLILRVFACVRQDRLYVEEYNRPASIPDEPVRLVGDNLKSLEIRT